MVSALLPGGSLAQEGSPMRKSVGLSKPSRCSKDLQANCVLLV